MKRRFLGASAGAALWFGLALPAEAIAGDAERGERLYRACAACHSLEPGRHMTGPSLFGIVGLEAGSLPDFDRYSPALREAGIVWDEESLDAWLADPQALVPGNRMAFRGMPDPEERADLIAFLRQADEMVGEPAEMAGSMMGAPRLVDLSEVGPDRQVAAIRHCRDTYRVTNAAGDTLALWEFNVRIKTDSSDHGPPPGRPALVPAGMMGDRVFLVFADPGEISAAIEAEC